MNKIEFLKKLKDRLSGFDSHEVEKALEFYEESIEDRLEDGKTEEEAISSLGNIDEIAQEIKMDMPFSAIVQSKIKKSQKKSKNKTLWKVLAICGIPIWLPIALALVVVAITAYIVLWVLIITLFVVIISLIASTILFIIYAIVCFITSNVATGAALIGASLVSIGIFIACIKPVIWSIKKLGILTGSFFKKIKKRLLKDKGGNVI